MFAKDHDGASVRPAVLRQLLATHIALRASDRRTEGSRVTFALSATSLIGMFTSGLMGAEWAYAIAPSAIAGALGLTGAVLASGEKVTMEGARDLLRVLETQLAHGEQPEDARDEQ